MGAVVLGFRWLWQSFQIAASVRLTITPFPFPQYVVAEVYSQKLHTVASSKTSSAQFIQHYIKKASLLASAKSVDYGFYVVFLVKHIFIRL